MEREVDTLQREKKLQVTPIYLKTTVSVAEAAKITGVRKDILREIGYSHPDLADYYGNPTKRRPKIKFKLALLQDFINNNRIGTASLGGGDEHE